MNIPPGRYLDRELTKRGISRRTFSLMLGISCDELEDLIVGNTHLNIYLAMGLEIQLGIATNLWMKLEQDYRAKLRRK